MKGTLILLAVAAITALAFTLPGTEKETAERSVRTVYGGIKFDKTSMSKAMAEAKASGKLIFIDVYTTWCGPCKQMARTTFQADEVGKVFNEKFINLKLDAENDVDGREVAKTYHVTGYPTLLFINGEGRLVKKLVGIQSEEKLLSIANSL